MKKSFLVSGKPTQKCKLIGVIQYQIYCCIKKNKHSKMYVTNVLFKGVLQTRRVSSYVL